MKLLVFTASYYDRDYDQKRERLVWSCKKFGIDLKSYGGSGQDFNFFTSKIVDLGTFLNNHKDEYTHALYTDTNDSFFLSDLEEIINKYEKFNSKLVVSAEKNCYPFGWLSERLKYTGTSYQFMNPGNFIGEIPYLLEVVNELKKFPHLNTNDQGHWMEAVLQEKITVTLDNRCSIFQTMSDRDLSEIRMTANGRVYNKETQTFPSVIHFNGPKGEGTYNDHAMKRVFANLQKGTQE